MSEYCDSYKTAEQVGAQNLTVNFNLDTEKIYQIENNDDAGLSNKL